MKVVTAEQCKEINLDYKEMFHKLLEDASVLSDACEAYEKIMDLLDITIVYNGKYYLLAQKPGPINIDKELGETLLELINHKESK